MASLEHLTLTRRVDAILAPWSGKPVPGMTIGVVRDGDLILHRSAGLASLELGVPIGPATAFRIASVSKQFTTSAILMLAAEGRLHIEDDSRKYLPELPELGHTITVAHLMHNTSGIRDMLELMRHGGVDLGNPVTTENLLDAICRQRGLNFPPGSRYLYSNSNFLLLGIIVERLTGESLPELLRTRIFAPLGMTMTRMTPSTLEPAPGLCTGYFPDKAGGWRRAPHAFAIGGEGGLVSSVEDLALWARNMETHRVGGARLAAALEETAPFLNGAPNGYARGLQVGVYRGVRTIGHGGLWPGYKTAYLRVPDRKLAVIVISNNGTTDPYHTSLDVLDVLIEGTAGVHAVPSMPPMSELERYVGRWLNRESGYTADLAIENGKLVGRTWGAAFPLRATEDGRLIASHSARDFVIRISGDGDTLDVEADAATHSVFHRAPAAPTLPEDLPGLYKSAELDAAWSITPGEGGLMRARADGPIVRGGEMRVEPIDGDFIRVVAPRALFDAWNDVRVLRDKAGHITGLHVHGGRARDFIFTRSTMG